MNKSKAAGTRAETAVVRFLEERGIQVRRKALTGSHDEGDVEVIGIPGYTEGVMLEVKAGRQTVNPNRTLLEEWLRQTVVEARHAKQSGFLVVTRYNRKLCDADVWWPSLDGSLHHMYLDEFASYLIEQ